MIFNKNMTLLQIKNRNYFIKWYSYLSTLLIALNVTQLRSVASIFMYAIIIITPLVTLFLYSTDQKRSVTLLPYAFLLIACISLIVNKFNLLFRPVERLILFSSLFIGFGPCLQSSKINDLRYLIVINTLKLFVVITLFSFISYLTKMPFAFGDAGFKGVTPHSMDLSPVSGLASLYIISLLNHQQQSKPKIYLSIFLICSIITMFISASRGAILGFGISTLFMLFYTLSSVKKFIKVVFVLIFVIVSLVVINPFSMMDGLNEKSERTELQDDYTGGRKISLEKRFIEFKENPIFGVGFSSMKYTNPTPSGHFEPGSGWVFILSSTGLLGILISLLMCIKSLLNGRLSSNTVLFASIILFFMIHSLIEGYILTVSNSFCIYMWMVVGLAYEKKYLRKYA